MPRYSKRSYQRPSQNSRLKKRWYFDASIPKSVPIIGGSTLRAGSGTLTKRSIDTAIKQAMVKNAPAKYKVINIAPFTSYGHNTWYTLNPLGNISVGTGDNSRLSSDIIVKNISLRMTFANLIGQSTQFRSQPLHVRVLWVRSENDVLPTNDTFASGLGSSDVLVSGLSDPFHGIIDKDKVTLLSDNIYRIPPATVDGAITYTQLNLDCPLKDFTYKYSAPAASFSSVNKNVYCIMVPYQLSQTGGTSCVEAQFNAVVSFVDAR